MSEMEDDLTIIDLAAHIVAAYVGNNSVPAAELPNLIFDVVGALNRVQGGAPQEVEAEPVRPARSGQEVGDQRLHHLSRGRKEVQVAQASSAYALQHVSGRIPREVEPAGRLPDGCSPTMRPLARTSPRRWVSVSSVVAAADQSAPNNYDKPGLSPGFSFCGASVTHSCHRSPSNTCVGDQFA